MIKMNSGEEIVAELDKSGDRELQQPKKALVDLEHLENGDGLENHDDENTEMGQETVNSGSGQPEHALIYNISDSPPIYLSLMFGLQQALLSLSNNLSISLLVADFVCAEVDEEVKAKLLGTTLFMSGVTTLMMTFVGVRLPLFQGAAGDFVIPLLVMAAVDKDRCDIDPHVLSSGEIDASVNNRTLDMVLLKRPMVMHNIQKLQGSLLLAGAIQLLIGATGLVGVILRFVGPVTIVPAILLLGVYLVKATVKFAKVHWGISSMTCALSLILALYMSKLKFPVPLYSRKKGCHFVRYPLHQMFAILIAILIGWGVCGILTVTNTIPDNKNSTSYYARTDARSYILQTANWFFFPYPGQFGPIDFDVGVFLGFIVATFTSILDSIGDYYACASTCRVPPPPAHAVNRGIAIEGFCSSLSGLLGCGHATTTYGGNIGAIGVTRVSSRQVFLVCGAIYIVFGLIGKVSAVFICIPYPVLGGALITMFGMFTGVVLSNLKVIDLSSTRNLAIIGTAIFTGLMLPYWIEEFPNELQTGSNKADEVLKILLGNPILFGGTLACFLDNTVPGTVEERGIANWQKIQDRTNTDYIEGPELYIPWMTERMKKSKILRYIPFLPSPQY